MQVKKYRAADSQQAMRLVRAAHGPDAVILDFHTIDGGVEVVVSLDDSSDSMMTPPQNAPTETAAQQMARQITQQFAPAQAPAPRRERTALDALFDRQKKATASAELPMAERQDLGASAPQHHQSERTAPLVSQSPQLAWSQKDELLTLKQELSSMKSMLMDQLKGHNWQQASFKAPEQRELNSYLASLDVDPSLGRRLCAEIPGDESDALQREILKMLLIKQLPTMTPPSVGAVCLVGPQGAGKTTTIAKIAAQHVLTHGREGIAILTTDVARVGAQEQLRAYGRILQIPVHTAVDLEEAVKTYRILRKKKLVLIDTAGMSFRDSRGINELLQLTAAMQDVQVFVTVPADAEAYVQSEIIDAYAPLAPLAAIVTRIDEAMRLGGVISNLIQHRLPVAWCANGPKVPQNLSAADGAKLVNMAVRMARAFELKLGPEIEHQPAFAEAAQQNANVAPIAVRGGLSLRV